MTEQKFEIEKTNDRGYVLWIDEKPSVCPFCPPVMVPGHMPGTANMVRIPCSTQCPLAQIEESVKCDSNQSAVDVLKYRTYCGCKDITRIVSEKELPNQQNQSGLLKSF